MWITRSELEEDNQKWIIAGLPLAYFVTVLAVDMAISVQAAKVHPTLGVPRGRARGGHVRTHARRS